jgi:hypothetical protein
MTRFLLACALVGLAAAPAFAADGPNTTLVRLKQLGVAVAVPAKLPPGFRLQKVLTPKAWGGPAFGPSYVALYQGPHGVGFGIQSAATDLGSSADRDDHPVETIKPRYFTRSAPVGLYWLGPRANMAKSWVSDWIEGPEQFYRLVGPGHVRNEYGPVFAATRDLDKAWALIVLDSIKPLGAPTRGPASTAASPRPFISDFEQDEQWKDIRTIPVR